MKRTTITLTDDIAFAREREARRRRTSVSEVARSALTAHFGLEQGKRRLPFVGLGASNQPGSAVWTDENVAKEWVRFIEEDSGLAGGR